ncbi:uncharacterized protein [Eurosta solidaginis]|uniref:uncharacterized protein isoform X2 n=1 Tax=Eurosta solidaginis TaxID=178769 RepID=UPI0035312519
MLCAKLFLLSCLVSVALTQPKESGSGVSTANMAAKSILTGSLRKFAINNENFENQGVVFPRPIWQLNLYLQDHYGNTQSISKIMKLKRCTKLQKETARRLSL